MQINIISEADTGKSHVTLTDAKARTQKLTLKSQPLDDVRAIAALREYFPLIPSGLFPPGLRYLSPDRRVICFERPPCYVDVAYTAVDMYKAEVMDEEKKARYRSSYTLPLPWLVYTAVLSPEGTPMEIYVYARGSSLTSLSDDLCLFPMMNIYTDSKLCRAPQDSNELNFPNTIEGAMASVYYAVWLTGFNHDLATTLIQARQSKRPSFLGKCRSDMAADILAHWSNQPLSTVVTANWLSLGLSLNDRIKQLQTSQIVDPGAFLVNRLSSACQNAL